MAIFKDNSDLQTVKNSILNKPSRNGGKFRERDCQAVENNHDASPR
jgi:hypothetical protein